MLKLDVSLWGWGASCGDVATGVRWASTEGNQHINCLELIAGSFAIHSFVKDWSHCCILLRTDNFSVVRYINKRGALTLVTCQTSPKTLRVLFRPLYLPCGGIPPGHIKFYGRDWFSRYWREYRDWQL